MVTRLFPHREKTLAAIRDAGLHLHAFCLNSGCGWHADVEIDTLIEKLGEAHSSQQPDLVPRLYCSQCEGKDLAIEFSGAADVPEAAAENVRREYLAARHRSLD
jgi:hypothetical protein